MIVAAAARAAAKSHIPLTAMPLLDRCFFVAELTAQGVTAKDIAVLSNCGERLVKYARAEPATIMALATRKETVEVEKEMRAERQRHCVTARRLAEAEADRERLRGQLDQILDKLQTTGQVETFACGHPRLEFNMYRNGGKRYCRKCRTKRQAEWRAETKKQNRSTCGGVSRLTTDDPTVTSDTQERLPA